jgi:hypothetical protein
MTTITLWLYTIVRRPSLVTRSPLEIAALAYLAGAVEITSEFRVSVVSKAKLKLFWEGRA